MIIDTILVPTDLTSHSVAAIEHAIALAHRFAARVHLAYVKPEIARVVAPELFPMPPELLNHDPGWARLELLRLQRRLLDAGVQSEVRLTQGSPAIAIPDLARQIGADLILMGTRGIGGLRRLLFGSTSEVVCRTAPCPVMVVRENLGCASSHRELEQDLEVSAACKGGRS